MLPVVSQTSYTAITPRSLEKPCNLPLAFESNPLRSTGCVEKGRANIHRSAPDAMAANPTVCIVDADVARPTHYRHTIVTCHTLHVHLINGNGFLGVPIQGANV